MPRKGPGGRADLIAGLAGGLFAPAASFGAGLPLWASIPAALAVFAGTRLALGPRGAFDGVDVSGYAEGKLDLAAEVLDGARADIDRLRACVAALSPGETRERLEAMRRVAEGVVGEVGRRPDRLSGVSRLLTYYLPASVRLGEGLLVLERAHRPDARRVAATAGMIGRLSEVFAHHADRVSAHEVEGLDVELTLLDEAIRSEEATRARAIEGNQGR